MKNIKTNYISIIFFLVLGLKVQAQRSLKIENVNITELNDSLWSHIRAFRATNNLNGLTQDQILLSAAKEHAIFCRKNNTTSHFRKSESHKTVYERVKKLEGTHARLEEIIVKLDMDVVRPKNHGDLSQLIIRLILKNNVYTEALMGKANTKLGFFLEPYESGFYVVMILGTTSIFDKDRQIDKDYYGLKTKQFDKKLDCQACEKTLASAGIDDFFDLVRKENSVLLVCSSKEYFYKLFPGKNDGIALDILRKEQFPCGIPNIEAKSPINYGFLQEPKFQKEMLKTSSVNEKGFVFIPIGEVPKDWSFFEMEFNVLLIRNKIVCQYNTFFQIPFRDWKLMPTPILENKYAKKNIEIALEKELTISIPFERNKIEFNVSELRPLADSLKLSQYKLVKSDVIAYSSIEGNEKNNEALQKKRVESLMKAIQTFQPEAIEISDVAIENWSEFYLLIEKSSKPFLGHKSHKEIKDYISSNPSQEIDSILSLTRKGVLRLKLERKKNLENLTASKVKTLVVNDAVNHEVLASEVIQSADILLIYNLFESVKELTNWENDIKNRLILEMIRYDSSYLEKGISELKLIYQKDKNTLTQYHICQLLLENAFKNFKSFNPQDPLRNEIWSLKNIDAKSNKLLKINWLILEVTYLKNMQRFDEKNLKIKEIIGLMRSLKFSDEERIELALFLAENQHLKEATVLLEARVKAEDVSEELLFLYINLTIIDDKIVQKIDYRAILTQASLRNKERFCKIFDSSLGGGITFQLLKNKYLKRSYCELCE